MKRILALAIVAVLTLAMFAGCTSSQAPASSAAPEASSTAPAADSTAPAPAPAANETEVALRWMVTGSNVVDDKEVMEKVNEYLKEKINASLEMIWGGWGDYDERATMAINGGDNIDIYFTSYWNTNEYVAYSKRGAYVRLDDPSNDLLAQYAPNYFNGMPAGVKDGMYTDGANGYGIYAVPAVKELAMQYVWEFNMDMFAKYDLKPEDFTDIYDMGPLLEKVKAGEGANFYPFIADYAFLARMHVPSEQIDMAQVTAFQFDPVNPSKSEPKIISLWESPQVEKLINQMHEYYQKGYINPSASVRDTMSQVWDDAKKSGQFLIGTRVAAPGHHYTDSAQFGYTEEVRNVVAGLLNTNGPRGAMHAISTVSKNPDRALQLLDLVNSDVYLHDLLGYGVEGVHYNLENGKVAFTDKNKDYQVWKAGIGQLAMYTPTVSDPDNIKQIIEDFNNVETSPLMGWVFNPDPVETELAALYNVVEEYHLGLVTGASDPARLPEFIQKLKDNGVDKVVEEANKQVQAFLASK